MADALDAFLMQVKEGGAKIPELARRLAASDGAIFVYPPEASAAALEAGSEGVPPVMLADRAGKPLACLFSDHVHVHAFAKANGIARDEAGAYVSRVTSWANALREILFNEYVGMMLDFGQPHSLMFSDGQVRKLYAYQLWGQHLSTPTLHVLWKGRGPHVLSSAQGTQASVAFDEALAQAMVSAFRARGELEMTARAFPLREGLRLLWNARVTQVVVNDELPDWHAHAREELRSMLAALGMEPAA